MKKLFIFSAVLLVLVLIFLGIYNLAFRKNFPQISSRSEQNVQNVGPNQTEINSVNNSRGEKISALSSQAVIGPFLNSQKQLIAYYATDGTVWQIGLDGKGETKTEATPVAGLQNVTWSPTGSQTLSKTRDGYFEYDHSKSSGKKLQAGMDLAVWSNEGNKIIYKYFDSQAKKRSLNVADPDGGNWKQIADIPFQKISIAPVPQSSLISFWELPAAATQSALQTVGSLGGEVKTIFTGKYGADYLWSPDGKKAAVSFLAAQNKTQLNLGIVTLEGDYQDLGIPTLVSKAVWSKDAKTLFYALAGAIPEGATMPDDYAGQKFISTDTFWKVDVTTGQKSRIVEPENITGDYDASQLMLSPKEDALFFVNRKDGKLYRLWL